MLGTSITKEDIEGLKVPVSMACTGMVYFVGNTPAAQADGAAENDQLFPDDIRAEGQKYLVDNGIPHEIQVFPGAPHGQSPRRR